MSNRASLVVVVALVLSLSGCPLESQQPGGTIQSSGDTQTTADGFRIDGEVENVGRFNPEFNNVTMYFYRENGSLITSEHVGTVDRPAEVSATLDEVPEYIIINSPEFWQTSPITVNYYEIDDEDGSYSEHAVADRDEFPVEVPPQSKPEQ